MLFVDTPALAVTAICFFFKYGPPGSTITRLFVEETIQGNRVKKI
jgi:hypothetical protein